MKDLSIAIPTYNRKDFLIENLRQIVGIIGKNKDRISLVISDNASTDGTDSAIQELLNSVDFEVEFYRHPNNIGSNSNFDFIISKCASKYVYLMGDDDVLFPNSINTMLEYISKYPSVSFFHFNYFLGNSAMNAFKLQYPNLKSGVKDVCYGTGKELIEEFFDGPSFMSSVLFKRDVWRINDVHKKKYDGYRWLACLYFNILSSPCVFSPVPIVAQRTGIGGYSKNWTYFSIVEMSEIFEELDVMSPGLYKKWDGYRVCQKYNLLLNICSVCYDKKRYRKLRPVLRRYLPNSAYKFFLDIQLYLLPKFVICHIEYFLVVLIKKINGTFLKYKYKK